MRGKAFGWAHRVGSVVVALALATPSTALASFGPSNSEVEKLYVEGQNRAEAKDYTGAADSWTRLLNLLEESPDNQAIRESVIINVLDAHLNAYNLLVDEAGNKDISHLRKGKATLDDYYGDFKTVHGERVAVSAAVQQKAEELEGALKRAEESAKSKPPPTDPNADPNGDPRPKESDTNPKVVVLEAQNNGNGLIIGGSVVIALGIGAIVMIPVGSIRGKKATTAHDDAVMGLQTNPNDQTLINQRDKALFDGKQANAILISGAVLAPLLLAGGVVMLVFGIKAKQRYNAQAGRAARLTPVFGRSYAGFSLTGKF